MKIGVISDTHIPGKAFVLPEIIFTSLGGAGHIVHAGDIASFSVIRALENIAPVTAVAGNVDPPEMQRALGYKKTVSLGGFTFGVVHGDGKSGTTTARAAGSFAGELVDCIIFGHSHIPRCFYQNGILFFNPGSPTDKRRNEYYSFGIIEINGFITPRLLFFNSGGIIHEEKQI